MSSQRMERRKRSVVSSGRVTALEDPPEPRPLLNAELWPLTGHYAFLDAPIETVEDALFAWRTELGNGPEATPARGTLREILLALQPLGLGHVELLMPTASSWTAYFANSQTGSDEAPLGYLAERIRCRALFLIWWPVPGYEALGFELLADHPTEFLNYERTVAVQRDDDGDLVFHAFGPIQPYERIEAYKSRRLRHRLTPRMLDDYSRALGVRPFDADFYLPPGRLVTIRDPRPDFKRSIAELQARYGFTPPAVDRAGH
jgi:hypothetical protein